MHFLAAPPAERVKVASRAGSFLKEQGALLVIP